MILFSVTTLQRGAFVSEPAILVRRMNSGSQIWSMEKLENKLIDMREMYQDHKDRTLSPYVSIYSEYVNYARGEVFIVCITNNTSIDILLN